MESPSKRRSALAGTVEITQSGGGGSIYYREGPNCLVFDWEFALSPAIAVLFGTAARAWDGSHPWACGRQAEIFDVVAAEVVRQKAPDAGCKIDLDDGTISVVRTSAARRASASRAANPNAVSKARHSAAYTRFLASIVPIWEHWADDKTYDIAAIADMKPGERKKVLGLLTARDVTWREVEALAAIEIPAARAAVNAASKNHLSIDTRVAAAEMMHRQGRLPDLDGFLACQIRQLSRPAEGMKRLLRIAAGRPSETIRQALLWASYNCTECAPRCAAVLLVQTGAATEPFDERVREMVAKLDLHNSSFDRQAAFDKLCRLVGMELDHDAAN